MAFPFRSARTQKHPGKQGFPLIEYLKQFSGEGKSRIVRLLLYYRFIGGDLAVADIDDAVCVLRDFVLVGYEDDGVSLSVKILEKRHDLFARFRIEVAGGLVCQH